MALTDLTRISTSGIATGSSLSGAILHGDAHFRGTNAGINSAIFDSSENELNLKDNVKLTFGNLPDFAIQHNTTVTPPANQLTCNVNSEFEIIADNLELRSGTGDKSYLTATVGSATTLFFNDNQKLRTTNDGVFVTGILTATSFSGGSGGVSAGVVTCTGLDLNGNGDISGNLVLGGNLTVNGTTTTLDTNLIGVDRVEVGANSNTVVGVAITQSGTADILNLYDGSTKKLVVDDQGNVGIKTLAPAHNLDVYLTGRFNQAGAGGHGVLVGGGTYTGGFTYMSSGDMEISCAMTNKDIVFSDAVGGNQRMRLTGDTGRLGIGTDNPASPLHIGQSTDDSVTAGITLKNNPSIGAQRFTLYNEENVGTHYNSNDGGTARAHIFETGGDERLRIDSTGEVSIATRNSANGGEVGFKFGSFGIRSQDTGGYNWWRIDRNYGGWQSDMISLRADGNVGINDSNPTVKLSVDGGTANNATVVQIKNDSTSAYSTTDGGINTALSLFSDGTHATQSVGIQFYLQKSGETGCISEIGAVRESSGNSNLVFRTRNSSTGRLERFRIT